MVADGMQFELYKLGMICATAGEKEARKVLANLREPLLAVNKCPDFVVNRGHYFGTSYFKDKDEPGLSDGDKRALIEFLKTF